MFKNGIDKATANLVFNFLFVALYLLSFFLIESEYKFYLFAFWSSFLLVFSIFLNKNSTFSKSLFIVFTLSTCLIFNTFFSINIPTSIEKLIFYIISLLIFIFLKNLNKQFFNKKLFIYYLSIAAIILNFFVLFFMLYAPAKNIFPGMNLIIRNYGHNHYAAFLLLVIPIFWWQFLFVKDSIFFKRDVRLFGLLSLIFSYILLFTSLARLIFVFSLLQLTIIFFLNKREILKLEKGKLISNIISILIFVFFLISISLLFLSLPAAQKHKHFCFSISNKEICQPIVENDRFLYWKQAIYILATHKSFGSGLKTFGLASRLFPLSNPITSYAHNIFLNNLAEMGIFTGSLFIIFILYIFYLSFKTMLVSKDKLDQFLWVAAIFSLMNAMLDFDWNFFVIFTLTLVYIAIILNNSSQRIDQISAPLLRLKSAACLKVYLFFIFIALSLLGILYMFATILSKNGRIDSFCKYFPFFEDHARDLFLSDQLSSENYKRLFPLYKNDPSFIYSFANVHDLSIEEKVNLQVRLTQIDPIFFIQNVSFNKINYLQARQLADQFVVIWQEYKLIDNATSLDYLKQRDVSAKFFDFGDDAYLDNNPGLAFDYYKKAILLNPYVMTYRQPAFLMPGETENAASSDGAVSFLISFKDFDPNDFGNYFYQYMTFYRNALIYLFQQNSLDEFYVLAETIFKYQPNFSWFLWRDLIAVSKTKEDVQRLEKIYEHFQYMQSWHDFLPLE